MKRYENVPVLKSQLGKEYRTTVLYPEVPLSDSDFYVITTSGDRYDTLANQFYSDYTLWWVIAAANNFQAASLIVPPGVQLRIPGNVSKVVDNYRKQNK